METPLVLLLQQGIWTGSIPGAGQIAYTASAEELTNLSDKEIFKTLSVVTGDLDKMLADRKTGNLTQKELGSNAFSLISISNAWAHGAPYDLLSAVMLHNHFCPGVSSGYLLARFVEEKMPIEDGSSYIVISKFRHGVRMISSHPDLTPEKADSTSGHNQMRMSQRSRKIWIPPGWHIHSLEQPGKERKGTRSGFQFDSSVGPAPHGEKNLNGR